jgi:hypothetical protein
MERSNVSPSCWDSTTSRSLAGLRESGRQPPAAVALARFPIELLSEVVDKEAARSSGRWTAIPLDPRQTPGELLVVAATATPPAETLKLVATTLLTAVVASRESTDAKRRVERLEAILSITARWNRAGKLDELLKEMAEAAARLLGAERASLFLWDERSRELVGRPALGIPGGELRVPDNQGGRGPDSEDRTTRPRGGTGQVGRD